LDAIVLLLDRPVKPQDAQACWMLAHLARAHPSVRSRVESLLVARLSGSSPAVASRAGLVLSSSKNYDALLLEILPPLMRHADREVHFPAVEAARQMGARAKELLPVLEALVLAPTPKTYVDHWALLAMGAVAPEEPRTVRAALVVLGDPKRKDVLPAPVDVLKQGGDTAIGLVAEELQDADSETRLALLDVLASFESRAAVARASVEPLLRAADERVVKAARMALDAFGR